MQYVTRRGQENSRTRYWGRKDLRFTQGDWRGELEQRTDWGIVQRNKKKLVHNSKGRKRKENTDITSTYERKKN